MGAFAAIGLILGFFALKRQDGRLGLLGAMLFGIGVAGDGGGMGVFVIVGLGIGLAGIARLDLRLGALGIAAIILGIVGDTGGWFRH